MQTSPYFHHLKLEIVALVPLLLGVLVLPAPAKDGRDFAGSYSVKAAVVEGPSVHVTLAFNFRNYSGADIAGGTLTLLDHLQEGKTYGSFIASAISDRDALQLQKDFTVTAAEYRSWLNGRTPLLVFERNDSSGHTIRRQVELVRIP
jgi:hypothetical protein